MNDTMKSDDEINVVLVKANSQFQQILDSLVKCQICGCELPKEFLLAHWQKECILMEKK